MCLRLGLTQLRPELRKSSTTMCPRLSRTFTRLGDVANGLDILSAGLENDVFNFDDPELVVHEDINKLVYDTLTYDVREKLQAEHSSLRYPAKVDPRLILAKEQRLVREINKAADWTPTELTRKEQLYASLDTEFYAARRSPPGDDKTVVEMLKPILGAVNKIETFVRQGNGPWRGSRGSS
ncbi:hypothetical protein CYMTET_39982 [Cymbomonas tetramitiformis]|uniref:Uncharacterized protein n=1 Tax=Cymbomonas tetramitiformis TaxID=36881 RepID=A0AAE0C913_9CHLO|nr:hypothetical protein CYMTET_39982 [Cymbomonas tetramitiformis]